MSESTESEYYNTAYLLYENNDTVVNNKEPPTQVSRKSHPNKQLFNREEKKQEHEGSLYEEDFYILPKGAKTNETSEPSMEMDQPYVSDQYKGSKSYNVIVGVVIGCLLTVAITTTCYAVMQKDCKGRKYNLWQQHKEYL